MQNLKTCFLLISIGGLFMAASAGAQDRALQNLIQGKKFFWEAKFDRALSALKGVTEITDAKREYLFEAHLYTGFVLLRQNAPAAEVNSVFKRAVNLDPKRKLDEMVIPPDLSAPFYEVRDQIVGCIYVTSEPEEVDLVGVNGDSVLFDETTPLLICDLVSSDYQLLLSERGYEQQFIPLRLEPGKTDTLHIKLNTSLAQRSRGGGTSKKGVKWLIRGGIVTAAGVIIYTTLSGGGSDKLPAPPTHPSTN
ncbi:MAG: hypothetical protein ACE5IY_17175 [bacterium]